VTDRRAHHSAPYRSVRQGITASFDRPDVTRGKVAVTTSNPQRERVRGQINDRAAMHLWSDPISRTIDPIGLARSSSSDIKM